LKVISRVNQTSCEEVRPTTVDMASSVKKVRRRLSTSWSVFYHLANAGLIVAESSKSIVAEEGLMKPSTYLRRCWHCSNGSIWLR
jgi:hypothetical protein